MQAEAITFEAPERLSVRSLDLVQRTPGDVVVEIAHSGISTGTEKLLWTGRMPSFPGMGYPLVPGYEAVGRIVDAEDEAQVGQWVFVPGANCFEGARGLFGGAANRLVVAADRPVPLDESIGRNGVLMALAATALHAMAGGDPPELIIGHGILGRLLARLTVASGAPAPTVWDINERRQAGAVGYEVLYPEADDRREYKTIYDVSGATDMLNTLIGRLVNGGEIVLAGFYHQPLSFDFAPAFRAEARLRVAAEWRPDDLMSVRAMIESGALNLDGLITHSRPVTEAHDAYSDAFEDPDCLKMIIDWSGTA